jgi:hypothetical protein
MDRIRCIPSKYKGRLPILSTSQGTCLFFCGQTLTVPYRWVERKVCVCVCVCVDRPRNKGRNTRSIHHPRAGRQHLWNVPLLGSGTSTGHSSPHTSNMQHEPSLGMGAPTRPSKKSLNSVLAKHSAWTSDGNVFHVASVSRRMRVHGDTDHVAEFRPIENEATMGERLRNVWCSCVCC